MAEQQVQLTDLDPVQLQEVKKQLDQVSRRAGAGRLQLVLVRVRARGLALVCGDLVILTSSHLRRVARRVGPITAVWSDRPRTQSQQTDDPPHDAVHAHLAGFQQPCWVSTHLPSHR
jgi:hypothetical protein